MINICMGCNKSITDLYYLNVSGQFYWHLGCLNCNLCNCSLQMQNKCYLNDGKFYCIDDYMKIKPNNNNINSNNIINDNYGCMISNKENRQLKSDLTCKKCNIQIKSNEYVIKVKNNENIIDSKYLLLFHLNCFLCNECGKQIKTGHKYGLINNKIFCSQHYYYQITNIKNYEINQNNYDQNQLDWNNQNPGEILFKNFYFNNIIN